MTIIKLEELIPPIRAELKEKGLSPVVLAKEDGTKLVGYIVDDDGLFWGIKVTPEESSSNS